MKYLRLFSMAVVVILVLQACGSEEMTTESGQTYTLVNEGDGKIPENGEYLVLNMIYGVGDSTWVDSSERGPVVLVKDDSLWRSGSPVHEIFAELQQGDSVTFDVTAETLFTKTWRTQLPPDLSPETMISFKLGLDTVMSAEGYGMWNQQRIDKENRRMEEEAAEQLETDVALIKDYLQANNIEAQETESGLHYVIHEEGSGPEANQLDTVSVNYTGYLLSGEYFDTSNEELAKEQNLFTEGRQYGPIEFVIGRSRIIRGWHEGIDLLSEGAKATLYIPSRYGYGPNASGDKIKENSVLVFDVELVEVN